MSIIGLALAVGGDVPGYLMTAVLAVGHYHAGQCLGRLPRLGIEGGHPGDAGIVGCAGEGVAQGVPCHCRSDLLDRGEHDADGVKRLARELARSYSPYFSVYRVTKDWTLGSGLVGTKVLDSISPSTAEPASCKSCSL